MKKADRLPILKRQNQKYKRSMNPKPRFPLGLKNGVILELLNKKHVKDLFRLADRNRKYLRRWLPWVDSTRTPADTNRFIEMARKQRAAKNGYHIAIFYEG